MSVKQIHDIGWFPVLFRFSYIQYSMLSRKILVSNDTCNSNAIILYLTSCVMGLSKSMKIGYFQLVNKPLIKTFWDFLCALYICFVLWSYAIFFYVHLVKSWKSCLLAVSWVGRASNLKFRLLAYKPLNVSLALWRYADSAQWTWHILRFFRSPLFSPGYVSQSWSHFFW